MRRMVGWTTIAAGLAMLTACGGDDGAGGVTAEESRQLNEISETLDTSADSLTVSEEETLGNGENVETVPAAENEAANGQ